MPKQRILFLTGKLAQASLCKVISGIDSRDFDYRIEVLSISVAALMTPEMIARRMPVVQDVDRIIIPGLCQGDLQPLSEQYGIPVERGSKDLKDLPQYLGKVGKPLQYSGPEIKIFAEIVDAPQLSTVDILKKAHRYRAQGADVIDLGCLPNTSFLHLEESIQALKEEGFQASVDSLSSDELLRGGLAGADYLLSLTTDSSWIAWEVASTPVLIPNKPRHMSSLYRLIDIFQGRGRAFIADPVLDPMPFGFAKSIVRFYQLRRRFPDISIMMGVGNLTELVDADTSGINAILFGIAVELNITAVLTTSVSPHARCTIQESDAARRLMEISVENQCLPRGYMSDLLCLRDKLPYPYSETEITQLANSIKDPSFRIQVGESGIYAYNRDFFVKDTDPFRFYEYLGVEQDASHAFYLGVELARAQIAWQLGKRYLQDEALLWGCNSQIMSVPSTHRKAAKKDKK